ncbi:hypothetical protein VNO80_07276 [Phaseolus coccineus]|uniref:Uncharacterized protein n=1 Tax=Phaseolus coccineus TaxID=3886 RepID=A0AAN9NJG4_PHACN
MPTLGVDVSIPRPKPSASNTPAEPVDLKGVFGLEGVGEWKVEVHGAGLFSLHGAFCRCMEEEKIKGTRVNSETHRSLSPFTSAVGIERQISPLSPNVSGIGLNSGGADGQMDIVTNKALTGVDGQTEAILKRRLFETPVDVGSGERSGQTVGGRSFFVGESSKVPVLLSGALCSKVTSCSSRETIIDSNILNCNRLFWGRLDLSSPLRIWELGQELGVTYEGEQELIIIELEEMEVRDRKQRNVPGVCKVIHVNWISEC